MNEWTELTPIEAERMLNTVRNELERAWKVLKDARSTEVAAKRAHRVARTEVLLGGRCPRISRDGYSAAERDAWVDRETEETLSDLEAATAMRENAVDYLRTVRDQASTVQSLSSSVRQAYGMAGS